MDKHKCVGCARDCDCGASTVSSCMLCFWCDTTNDDDWTTDDYEWDDTDE